MVVQILCIKNWVQISSYFPATRLSGWEVMFFNCTSSVNLCLAPGGSNLFLLSLLPGGCGPLSGCLAGYSCCSFLPAHSLLSLKAPTSSFPHVRVRALSVHSCSSTARGWYIPSGEGKKHPEWAGLRIFTSCHHCSSCFSLFSEGIWLVTEGISRYVGNLPGCSLWFWHRFPWFQANNYLSLFPLSAMQNLMLITRTPLSLLLLAFSHILGNVLFPNRAELRICKSQDGHGTRWDCHAHQCSIHLQAVVDRNGFSGRGLAPDGGAKIWVFME